MSRRRNFTELDEWTRLVWTAMCESDLINEVLDMAYDDEDDVEIANYIETCYMENYPFKWEDNIYGRLLDKAFSKVNYEALAKSAKEYIEEHGLKYF